MTTIPKRAEIKRIGDTNGFELLLDGEPFPWYVEREDAEVVTLTPDGDLHPMYALRIGILIDGPITGADEFNEQLTDELDRSRITRSER